MGQFNSKVFDGDSYIDLMRAVPEREITWWVQKVIWIAQGYTALEHAGRAWPPLLLHRCRACDGHGSLTCPHCRGAKLRSAAGRMSFLGPDPALMPAGVGGAGQAGGAAAAAAAAFGSAPAPSPSSSSPGPSSSSSSSPLLAGGGAAALAAALATAPASTPHNDDDGDEPCRHCGDYLPWDDEGAWRDRWRAWEGVAAYYDRSLGPLMDEWHEDAVLKTQRQLDSPDHDYFYNEALRGPPPVGSPYDDGPSGRAAAERWGKAAEATEAAMSKRFGGHPYVTNDALPFDLIDGGGGKSTGDNLWRVRALGAREFGGVGGPLLPPELDPTVAPALARAQPGDLPPWGDGGGGAFLATPAELASEIAAQARLAQNLEAAARGGAKPHAFAATAGTVPCPECAGAPWAWSWVPNFRTLMGSEPPPMLKAIWARTEDRARVAGQLRAAGMAGGAGGGGAGAGGGSLAFPPPLPDLPRPLLEYPSLAADALPLDPVGREAALSVLEGVAREGARQQQARRAAAAREAAAASPAAERQREEAELPFSLRERALAGEDARGEADAAERALALEPHPLFGDSDPLSDDYAKATDGKAGGGGGDGAKAAPPPADWPLRAAMPGRQAARQLRDVRLLKALEREGDAEGKAALEGYLARRGRGRGGGAAA